MWPSRSTSRTRSNAVSAPSAELTAPVTPNGASISVDAEAIWQAARSQLAMQMPAATYDTWMRDTRVVAYEDGEFIIGIPNAYVRDWLENRLRNKIKKTLSALLGRSVQINFRVVPPKAVNEPARSFAPLYEQQGETRALPNQNKHESHTHAGYTQEATELVEPVGSAQDLTKRLRDGTTLDENYLYGQEPSNLPPHVAESQTASYSADAQLGDGGPAGSDWRGTMHSPGMLNPAHTFDNFVVGNHNRLAHAAAQAIAESPGQSFNPLFVYGGVGLGKTHLLHAVGNQARQRGFRLLYCSSEQFTHELIMAIRSQSTEEFRNKYRQVDMLLIDDIQFISGKESTQEEFFHTFNYLHAAGRQVVLSSDRPPKALGTLDDRLRSRFEGGLQTDISQPDFETRVAILQSKALKTDLRIHRDVLMLIAERVESNVRELEGVLNRMVLQARLFSSSLDLALAENILRNLAPQRTPRSPSIVIRVVAEFYHLQPDDLTGRTRTKDIAHARQVAMYLLREENALSLPAIGDHLGGRDHSTVRYGVDKITGDLDDDETLRREVTTLREKIYMEPGF
ncbi:MAG: chromosomal replication initiator protein DnaA [Caldilineaceae bacterium]